MREKIDIAILAVYYAAANGTSISEAQEKAGEYLLTLLREEIKKGLLMEEELLPLFYPIPRAKLQMRWFEAVAQAQLQKILALFRSDNVVGNAEL